MKISLRRIFLVIGLNLIILQANSLDYSFSITSLGGYETGKPLYAGQIQSTPVFLSPYISSGINWGSDFWKLESEVTGTGDFFYQRESDYNVDGNLESIIDFGSHHIINQFRYGYIDQLNITELDNPISYNLVSTGIFYQLKMKHDLKVGYSIEVTDDHYSTRTDFKHNISINSLLKWSSFLQPLMGISVSKNESNNQTYAYESFKLNMGLVSIFAGKYFLTFMGNFSPKYYKYSNETLGLSTTTTGNGKALGLLKKQNNPITQVKNRSTGSSLILNLSREWTPRLEGILEYGYFFYNSKLLDQSILSHRFSAGFSWHY